MILVYRLIPGYPLVLAANRDEFLDRGFSHPHLWPNDASRPRIFAGRDERLGGTWFGVNQHGIISGIVNRYTGHKDPTKRSRGHIVLDCLLHGSLQAAERFLENEDLSRYNPFTLFLYDRGGARIITNHQTRRSYRLREGIHVMTNCDPDDDTDPKKNHVRAMLGTVPHDPEKLRDTLVSVCMDHGGPQDFPFPVCVHLEGYGTVSSCILMVGERPDASRVHFCEGPPCKGTYVDLTHTLLSLSS